MMVDIGLLQSLSYVAAAIGVCVATFYYVMMLREQRRNMRLTLETRRIGIVENMIGMLHNPEGWKINYEVMNYEWRDYDDFERKYGSDFNVDAAAKRYYLWSKYNSVGAMLRKGMVEAEDLYDMGIDSTCFLWSKYGAIIEEIRRRYRGKDYLRDLEYLNSEMMRVKLSRDPSYRIPETLTKYIPDN